MPLNARIADFMSPHPITLHQSRKVGRAREIFLEQGFSILPIVDDDGCLCGVVSTSDLVRAGDDEHLDERPVGQVMTERVVTAASTATITDAAVSMTSHRIHHLIVTDLQNRPIGVLSGLDIATAMADAELGEEVRTLMTTEVVTVDVGTPVAEALDLIEEVGVSAAVVRDANDIVGVLSKLSLLKAGEDHRVDQVMDGNVVNVDADDTVSEVAEAFTENSARRLLVIDGNGLVVGIVTPTDLVHYAAGLAEFDGPAAAEAFEEDEDVELIPFDPDDEDEDEDEAY